MVIYLRQEGRNIGLLNKVNAYALQDKGMNTIEANHQLGFRTDERSYEIVEYILNKFDIKKINLLTNRKPIIVGETSKNKEYLKVKKEQMGHLL